VGAPALLRGHQFGDADQVIGDQIEQEVGGDASDAAMFGLAHGAMLLAPSENALDHRPSRLRHAIALMPGGSFIDGTGAGLAGFGDGLVLCHMRRHTDGAKIGDMIGRIIRLVLTGRDAAACGFASRLQHGLRSPAFGGAIGMRDPAGYRQPVPVLHGGVAHIAKLGLPSGRLAIKPAVRVAGTRMSVVLALSYHKAIKYAL
jgi:hypothetical protein